MPHLGGTADTVEARRPECPALHGGRPVRKPAVIQRLPPAAGWGHLEGRQVAPKVFPSLPAALLFKGQAGRELPWVRTFEKKEQAPLGSFQGGSRMGLHCPPSHWGPSQVRQSQGPPCPSHACSVCQPHCTQAAEQVLTRQGRSQVRSRGFPACHLQRPREKRIELPFR